MLSAFHIFCLVFYRLIFFPHILVWDNWILFSFSPFCFLFTTTVNLFRTKIKNTHAPMNWFAYVRGKYSLIHVLLYVGTTFSGYKPSYLISVKRFTEDLYLWSVELNVRQRKHKRESSFHFLRFKLLNNMKLLFTWDFINVLSTEYNFIPFDINASYHQVCNIIKNMLFFIYFTKNHLDLKSIVFTCFRIFNTGKYVRINTVTVF